MSSLEYGGNAGSKIIGQIPMAALVGGVVFLVSLFGILLRLQGFLSVLWPANAILLGLMLRRPALATPLGWIAAIIGYFAADLLTGSTVLKTLLLTSGNLAGVFVGYVLFTRLEADERWLRRPSSTISFLLILAMASIAAGLVGMIANPVLFNGGIVDGFFFWAIGELVNYIAILPVILTMPARLPSRAWLARMKASCCNPKKIAPVTAYVLSLAIIPVIGGPGVLAFPVPSLLWCALSYSLATTTLLTFSCALWTLVAISGDYIPFEMIVHTEYAQISLRLGVMLIAIAPITVASVMAARNELLREAAAARAAAEEAMATRSLLLATMTHELRSPLNAIIGFSSIMASEKMGSMANPTYVDYAQSIVIAGNHLNDLVTDLLDTAKIEAGEIHLTLEVVSSRDTIDQSLRLVRGLATEAGIKLSMAPGDWPDVQADSRAVKQVLINLLSNAIKFSPKGAAVTVSGETSHDRLAIRVKDWGKGISAEDLARLGHAYVQAGDEETRRQGTGLGLALSSKLVERHGGRLRLESTLGQGTTAIFDLPLVSTPV